MNMCKYKRETQENRRSVCQNMKYWCFMIKKLVVFYVDIVIRSMICIKNNKIWKCV